MRVLLLGATGNLGSRLVPALIAHHHILTVLVRNPGKLHSIISPALLELVDSVVEGNATDPERIKQTIKQHNIEAIVDVAGNQVLPWKEYLLPKIAKAVCEAAVDVGKERGRPIRIWVTVGLGLLRLPESPYLLQDYAPKISMAQHKATSDVVEAIPQSDLLWSELAIGMMRPVNTNQGQFEPIQTNQPYNLLVNATTIPSWQESWLNRIPLIGTYLQFWKQLFSDYITIYEDVADFLAEDLELGNEQWLGKRVGLKQLVKKDV